MGRVEAICTSLKKGERKSPVNHAGFVADHGMESDAHAGPWHRQLSILAAEDIEQMRQTGLADIKYGDFAENLVLSGIELDGLGLGSRLRLGSEVELTITQIGKVCHTQCRIYHLTGDCIMPRRGLFARVIVGG
jgi:MOSC domain-containing protein YiiM